MVDELQVEIEWNPNHLLKTDFQYDIDLFENAYAWGWASSSSMGYLSFNVSQNMNDLYYNGSGSIIQLDFTILDSDVITTIEMPSNQIEVVAYDCALDSTYQIDISQWEIEEFLQIDLTND